MPWPSRSSISNIDCALFSAKKRFPKAADYLVFAFYKIGKMANAAWQVLLSFFNKSIVNLPKILNLVSRPKSNKLTWD
jgi:hypothetical protein